MPIQFSDHSKQQLKRRKISQKLAIKVIRNPDSVSSSFKGRKLRRIKVGGKILVIVTRTEGSRITIVTGYYLKQ